MRKNNPVVIFGTLVSINERGTEEEAEVPQQKRLARNGSRSAASASELGRNGSRRKYRRDYYGECRGTNDQSLAILFGVCDD